MIHVAYGLHDKDGRYSKFTGTSMLSLFENTAAPITVHILHDNTLNLENRNNFNYIAERYNQKVKFYNVEKLCVSKIAKIKKNFTDLEQHYATIGMFYRFFCVDILNSNINKIIYLDSDIAVNLDINELWQIELANNPLAAVTEVSNETSIELLPLCIKKFIKFEDYFNSGVLVMNLKFLRNEKDLITRGTKFLVIDRQNTYIDQDILNYLFSGRFLKLPVKFNTIVRNCRWREEFSITQAIYHYNTHMIKLDLQDNFNRLWFKYFVKTPWFNEEIFAHFNEGICQLHTEQKKFALNISEIMSGKTRAFFVQPDTVEEVKRIFRVKPNEEIISADSPESTKLFINSIQNSNGKKVFFLLLRPPEYFNVSKVLTGAGFTAGEDFLDAMKFLSDAEGFPPDTYPFVKIL